MNIQDKTINKMYSNENILYWNLKTSLPFCLTSTYCKYNCFQILMKNQL